MGSAGCCSLERHASGEQTGDFGKESQRRLLAQLTPFSPRLSLKVKDGGFAAETLIPTNRGSLSDLYFLETDTLGEGNYSIVTRCTKKSTLQSYALKSISGKSMSRRDQFDKEIEIMRHMDHPNIVRMIESFREGKDLYLVLELCEGGQLFDILVDRGALSQRPSAIIICQILRAANYLHSNHVVHRDFKAENLLLAEDTPPESTTIKLCDFGLAKTCMPGEFAATKVGTPYYVAPELLSGKYTQAVDMWAIGVILYMLLGGCPPFSGNNTQEVLENVRMANVNVKKLAKTVSDDAKELLLELLKKNPEQRISASDALKHRWIDRTLQDFEFAAKRGGAIRKSLKDGNFGGFASNIASGLKNFSRASPAQKVVMHLIASQLSRESLADLEQAFLQMDLNGDGNLNIGEFMEGLKRAGVTIQMEEIATIFSGIDADGSGRIDYSEFCAAMMDNARISQDGACFKAFNVFDLNGSGTVEREELKKTLESSGVSPVEVEKLFKHINGDEISFEDFMIAMNRLDKSGGTFADLESLLASAKALTRKAARTSSRKSTTSASSSPMQSSRKKSEDSPRSPEPSARKKTIDQSPRSPRRSARKNTDASPQSARNSTRKKTEDSLKTSTKSSNEYASESGSPNDSTANTAKSPKASSPSPRNSARKSTRRSTRQRDTS